MTYGGGAFGAGNVFSLTKGGMLTTLASFNGANGANPYGGLIADPSGTLYGTTYYGGTSGSGTVFSLTSGGTLTTLASFNGSNGANPEGSLIADASGTVYGTTTAGGAFGGGTVFSLSDTGFAVVPEPGSWAMLMAGFGLIGAAARRQRRVAT